ncbi:hypothetical protein X740_24770 [Mesorhizobium sp. LNHC221B00]|nr:hypothetical protein X740_24770 [Mesorhizobium sp. LNHC221B00]
MLKEVWKEADDRSAFDYPFQRRANDPSFYSIGATIQNTTTMEFWHWKLPNWRSYPFSTG